MRKKEKALDEIEGYCEKILSDVLHYSQGTVNTAKRLETLLTRQRRKTNARYKQYRVSKPCINDSKRI